MLACRLVRLVGIAAATSARYSASAPAAANPSVPFRVAQKDAQPR